MENTSQNNNSSSPQGNLVSVDKRPLYIWLAVVLLSVGICGLIVIGEMLKNDRYNFTPGISESITGLLLLVLITLVIPVILSKLNIRWKNYLGLVIPIIVLVFGLLVGNCSSSSTLCMTYYIYIPIYPPFLIYGSLVFMFFYLSGIYLVRWNVRVVLSVLLIEGLLLLAGIGFIGYLIHIESSLKQMVKNSGDKESLEIFRECDSFSAYAKMEYHCRYIVWMEIINKNSGKDVCSWVTEERLKYNCHNFMTETYMGRDMCKEYFYYGKETGSSDEEDNYQKMRSCWVDRAQMYPSLNICSFVQESNNNKKCRAVLGD